MQETGRKTQNVENATSPGRQKYIPQTACSPHQKCTCPVQSAKIVKNN